MVFLFQLEREERKEKKLHHRRMSHKFIFATLLPAMPVLLVASCS